MIAVVCMKWGTRFGADYVNVLYRAVTRNLSYPFRFYCFTDDATGLDEGVLTKPIPDMDLASERIKRGCWPKVGLFRPGLIEEETALFVDLDVVITRSLDPFVERKRAVGGLHIIREWNPGIWNLLPAFFRPDRGGQSSVVCWSPSEQHAVYDSLMADPAASFALSTNDQQHITRTATARHYWPLSWTASFKRACVPYYPLNLIINGVHKPAKASIVVFHGKPRPHELVMDGTLRWGTKRRYGFGPVSWVREYWLTAAGANKGQGIRAHETASSKDLTKAQLRLPA